MSRKDGLVAEGAGHDSLTEPDFAMDVERMQYSGTTALTHRHVEARLPSGVIDSQGDTMEASEVEYRGYLTKQPSSASEWRAYVESENPHLLSRLLGQPLFEDQHGVERAIKRPSDTLTSSLDKPGTGLPLRSGFRLFVLSYFWDFG